MLLVLLFTCGCTPLRGQKSDDAVTVIRSCGTPHSDQMVGSDNGERVLSYPAGDLHFYNRETNHRAWRFAYADFGIHQFDRAAIAQRMPCFAAVGAGPAASMPAQSSGGPGDLLTGVSFVFVVLLLLGAVLYFVPYIIARSRRVERRDGIAALNLFLGWTFIGWIGALIWACTAETIDQAVIRRHALAQIAAQTPRPPAMPTGPSSMERVGRRAGELLNRGDERPPSILS